MSKENYEEYYNFLQDLKKLFHKYPKVKLGIRSFYDKTLLTNIGYGYFYIDDDKNPDNIIVNIYSKEIDDKPFYRDIDESFIDFCIQEFKDYHYKIDYVLENFDKEIEPE